MGEQEKQVYHLMGEIKSNVAEIKNLAHGLHDTNRKIGSPPPSQKAKLETPPEGKEPAAPNSVTDHLMVIKNSAQDTLELLRAAVEDLDNLV